jgi:hypothetical protein
MLQLIMNFLSAVDQIGQLEQEAQELCVRN